MSKIELNLGNLDDAITRAERRREKFREFKTLFFGVVVGAVISAPLQLMLKPLKFETGAVAYGSAEIMTNLHPFQYFIVSMLVGMGVILALIFSYRLYIRFDFDPSIPIRLPENSDAAFDRIKEELHDEAASMDLDAKVDDNVAIFYDPNKASGGLLGDSDNTILSIQHSQDLGVMEIKFNQRDWRHKPLIQHLKREFS